MTDRLRHPSTIAAFDQIQAGATEDLDRFIADLAEHRLDDPECGGTFACVAQNVYAMVTEDPIEMIGLFAVALDRLIHAKIVKDHTS